MLLYKYFPQHNSFFTHLSLRATQRTALNDPFELLPSVKSRAAFNSKHDVHGRKMTQEEWELEFLHDYRCDTQHYTDGIGYFEHWGIISLSASNNNLLMWSHYSSNHSGYVIQFETELFAFPDKYKEFPKVAQVIYQEERPSELIEWKDWFLYKSKQWEYEKEYRVILSLSSCSEKWSLENSVVNRNPKLNPFSPLEKCPNCMFMFHVPEAAIRQVYIGFRMDLHARHTLLAPMLANHKLAHMEVFDSYINPNDFRIEFKKSYEHCSR